MSLQLAAQHLEKHGRNGDTMLVHMSPREVKSLSDLAMAHGGHLTINPTTGLPEAGFLSSILPMIAGVGLSAISGGMINPMTAGLLVGGITGVASGSLSKGLMAGLGAYGGAGMGQALAMSGVEAAAAPEIAASQNAAIEQAKILGSQAQTMTPEMFAEKAQAITSPLDSARAAAIQNAQNTYNTAGFTDRLGTMGQGVKSLGSEGGIGRFYENLGRTDTFGPKTTLAAAAAPAISEAMQPESVPTPQEDKDLGQRYVYEPGRLQGPYTASPTGIEQQYFEPRYRKVSSEEAKNIFGFADGGEVPEPGEPTKYSYDPTKQMFNKIESMPSDDQTRQATEKVAQQRVGGINTPMTDAQFAAQQAQGKKNAEGLSNLGDAIGQGFMSFINQPPAFVQIAQALLGGLGFGATPGQATMAPGPAVGSQGPTPGQAVEGAKMGIAAGGGGGRGGMGNVGTGGGSTTSGVGTGIGGLGAMGGGLAAGGLSHLGDYSDGGRLLRGPGDGVSDSIPAMIGKKQPARLADGEFVVPARIVSELGNGSTEAGARKLYAMMDRVQKARGKTVGKGKVAKNSRAERFLPA